MAARGVVVSVWFSWATRDSHKPPQSVLVWRHIGRESGPRQSFTEHHTKQSTCGRSCVRWRFLLLEDSVSTAERFRPRIVARAQHVLVVRSVDLRLRRDEVRRGHVANTVQASAQASCDHDRGALLLASVRQCVCPATSRECPWRGRPDLRGMCHEKLFKIGPTQQCDPPFYAWCFRKRRGRMVTWALFSPRKCVTTVTWNSRVNMEDFFFAEANHVQIQTSAL